MHRITFLLVLVATLCVISGCGETGPKTYPVTGKLTIGGQPASDILVTFQPAQGGSQEPANGKTDAQGVYTLYTGIEGKVGASPGKYKVVLAQAVSGSPEMYQNAGKSGPALPTAPFSDEWSKAESSPKEVEVKTESNTIDIDVPARS